MRLRRGFTLIELLVVIAIIGILASVVLASLNIAREKGRDSALKADFDSVVQQASLYYESNGNSYGTAANDCTAALYSDPTIVNAFTHIRISNSAATTTCYAADTTYGFAAARPASTIYTPDTTYWCADSSGGKCGVNDLTTLSSTGQCGCGS